VRARLHHVGRQALGSPIRTADGETLRNQGRDRQEHIAHTLRHSFATDLYRETSKIRLVQKVLGHSDLSTTMIYTHIFDEEVESALESFRQAAAVAI